MPADLLGEFGEGYCGRCQFVIGLDRFGKLLIHWRGRHLDTHGIGSICEGSLRRPWKRTPYACRKNAFRFEAPKIACPVCGQPTVIVHAAIAGDRLKHHWPADGPMAFWCTGSNLRVIDKGRVVTAATGQ